MNLGQMQGQGQAGRQNYPYQNQYQMGSQGLNYYPYTGVGAGSQYGGGSQYGAGQCKYKNFDLFISIKSL
jgi:hypothetical protein